jgi:16S rRNA (cytidine1402-2'-O)-methyltransferase
MDFRGGDMSGILYLCATPIGNLGDMTKRVVDTLREVDLIAAEDTRNSRKLAEVFQIATPMTSYHEHNKVEKGRQLITKLIEGKNIALITDAGTPAISDPGEMLVQMCCDAGIQVTSLPGASACITALSLSGISSGRFCFEGFLPSARRERKEILEELKGESRTIILYEAPHHLIDTLKDLEEAMGDRKLAICRELTKKYETVIHLTLREALRYYETQQPRGEYVLVLEGKSREERQQERVSKWEEMDIGEHYALYIRGGVPEKEAMKQVAKDRGISKRDVYQAIKVDG